MAVAAGTQGGGGSGGGRGGDCGRVSVPGRRFQPLLPLAAPLSSPPTPLPPPTRPPLPSTASVLRGAHLSGGQSGW